MSGSLDRIVDAWCEIDHKGAFLKADHEAIEATRALRGLVSATLERLLRVLSQPRARVATQPEQPEREPKPDLVEHDLVHAFGAIGRAFAEGRASPTLAAATVDSLLAAHARCGLPPALGKTFAAAARSAVFETYALVTRTTQQDDANRRWEYPACVVPLPDAGGAVAVAAGYPVDDDEALVGWASRVAQALSLAGVRRTVVAGSEKAVLALMEALELAGIAATQTHLLTPRPPGPRSPHRG